ncbi:carboxymuconolactone decarboxylase family protein [Rhodococcus gannanensis]|uniref:Carboxymuconolactone decarboxylase family protein n=1 Tax=Rhodococcus gannanensis TaxID=1960308 RepID=A0ABW4P8X7_9NOCA
MGLAPLPADEWDDDVRKALMGMLPRDRQNPEGAGIALATLVRHPDLTRAFLGFSVHLLFRSTLSDRLRELVILRVAHRQDCAYESAHHTDLARMAGLTDAEIEAARLGKSDVAFEQVVLGAVDELFDNSRLSDRTWAALGEHLDEKQLMDFVFTAGCYSMMALAFNSFGIEPEHER